MPIDKKLAHWADKEYSRKNYPYCAEKLQMGLENCIDDIDARKKLRLVARQNLVENPKKGLAKMKHATSVAKLKTIMKTKKKLEDIVVAAEHVLFEEPNDISTLVALSSAFEQLDLNDLSLWVLEDAIKLEPTNIDLWRSKGLLCHKKMDDREEAKKCYEKVLKIDSTQKDIEKMLRTIEAEKAMVGDKAGAKKGIAVKDENEAMRDETLRKIIRNADDARAQVKFFLEDLENDPKNVKIMEKIADRYRQGELYKECIVYLEKALALESSNETIRIRIGEVKLEMAKATKEKHFLAYKKNPKDEKMKENYKKSHIYELKMGLLVYEDWVAAHPTDLRMKFRYGEYLYIAKKYKEALSMFQKSAGDPKIQHESNEFLARCFMALEKPKMAIKPLDNCLAKLNEGSDTWKEIIYLKAQCYSLLGEKEVSQELFEKIYEIDIDFKDVADLI